MTASSAEQTRTPAWSARPYTADDQDAVLALFTAPDFHFRATQPDTRPEWEILALLAEDDTYVLLADGEPIGLYALEGVGADHGCHFQLHLRLSSAVPIPWWRSAYEEIVRVVRWRRELVRLALLIGEFDDVGLRAARSLGITEEGVLADVVVHEGRRAGYVFFSQVWRPTS